MKKISSELGQNYDTYTFGYAQYAQREGGEPLAFIYENGYLPYSGSPNVQDIFYMARSARVPLPEWRMTSENRRIAKKFNGAFEKKRIARAEFVADEDFYGLCLGYFSTLHGERAMPRTRLEHILSCGLVSDVIEYRREGKPVAYVLEVSENGIRHYWFSFYSPEFAKQSLGLWLMQDGVRDAKEAGAAHYYLGTVYGERALYKTNFEPLQWWNGSEWSADVGRLKERGRTDGARLLAIMDEWKEGRAFF